jgi:segregation and condensation protein A
MPVEVRTTEFEGPLGLLLTLILRQEVDLWKVSLSTIVDEYLAELDRLDTLDLELATEFLLIAATLIELKTRRLLPTPTELDLEEELLRFEERDLLVARLLEYKTFTDAAAAMVALMRRAELSVARLAGPEDPFRSLVPDPLERVKLIALRDAARRALAPHPPEVVDTDHIAPVRVSVAEAIVSVLANIPPEQPVTFQALVADAGSRLEIIVRFLAILELFKQGVVDLDQPENFGTLSVRRIAEGDALDVASIADWGDETSRADEGDRADESTRSSS